MRAFIGFFDILGYQAFLKNNSAEAEINKVLETIASFEDGNVLESVKSIAAKDKSKEPVIPHFKSINWMVFSDTIVCSQPYAKTAEARAVDMCAFLTACTKLCLDMFEFGLPLRGAITVGEIFQKKHSIAGRGIVDAYQYMQDIDAAIPVMTPEFTAELPAAEAAVKSFKAFVDGSILEYAVPIKPDSYRKEKCMDFLTTTPDEDIRSLVYESFWGHKKTLDSRAVRKADETERFLRYCRMWKKNNSKLSK